MSPQNEPKYPLYIYCAYSLFIFFAVFAQEWSLDTITHIIILGFFGLCLTWYHLFPHPRIRNPRKFFILAATAFALVVEGAYMISRPLSPSLIITSGMAPAQMFHNYAIDALFTTPAYFVIFWVIWKIITRYRYTLWEYVVFISLGQALGDGMTYFSANIAQLFLIPYIMVNYQAMNVVPFLLVRSNIQPHHNAGTIKKLIVPLVIIPAVYFVAGAVILTIGRSLRFFT